MHFQLFLKNYKLITFFLLVFSQITQADQLIIEPEMGRKPIIQALQDARYSIKLVMYGMTDHLLRNEIINQKNRGITVKVILEQKPYKNKNENQKTLSIFNKNQINWIGKLPNIHLIHQKTWVIDQQKACIMTFNFTHSSFKNERNFGLIIDDAKTVNEIENIFSSDWNHKTISLQSSRILLGPEYSRKQFLSLINNTKKTLDIYVQELTDYQIIGALAKAAHKNIKIRILTSRPLTKNREEYLKNANIMIHDHTQKYIHAKVFIIDKQMLVLGSTNLTQSSLDDNRELSILSHDVKVIHEIQNTFDSDWLNSN